MTALRLHLRLFAALDGIRFRRRLAPHPWHCRHRRNDPGHGRRHPHGSSDLRGCRVPLAPLAYVAGRYHHGFNPSAGDGRASRSSVGTRRAGGTGMTAPTIKTHQILALSFGFALLLAGLQGRARIMCGRKSQRHPHIAVPITRWSRAPIRNPSATRTWQMYFSEPELQQLIRTALENNYDVRIAAQASSGAAGPGSHHALTAVSQRNVGGTGIGRGSAEPAGGGISSGSATIGKLQSLGSDGILISGAFIAGRSEAARRNCSPRPGLSEPYA